jgi:F0F1-type ATP synthase delta subunit
MQSGSLARRYAKAVFAIGAEQGGLDKIGADIRTFANAMKDSAELTAALTSPAIQRADRRKIVDGLLQHIGAYRARATSCTCCSKASDCARYR